MWNINLFFAQNNMYFYLFPSSSMLQQVLIITYNDGTSVISSTCPQCNAILCPMICLLPPLESNQTGMDKCRSFSLSHVVPLDTNLKEVKEFNTQSHTVYIHLISQSFICISKCSFLVASWCAIPATCAVCSNVCQRETEKLHIGIIECFLWVREWRTGRAVTRADNYRVGKGCQALVAPFRNFFAIPKAIIANSLQAI